MVTLCLMVSNAAPRSTAAGSEAARLDSAVESKVALSETAVDSNVALLGSAAAAAEVLAPASAILHWKLPNREPAAPKRWFGASTGQAALNQAATWRIQSQRQVRPRTSKW
jgi:hypothetical protein